MTDSKNINISSFLIPTKLCVVYGLEAVFILLGNSLTMLVFWRRKHILKRTTYFVINLAVADSIVGLSTIANAAVNAVSNESYLEVVSSVRMLFCQVNFICVAASILSLACIALERVFAFVRTIEHRTTKTRYYRYVVGFVWFTAVLFCAFSTMGVVVFDFPMLGVYISVFVYGTCLFVISISYVVIWWTISKRPAPEVLQRKLNRKIAVTLSAITFLSLVTFIPGQVCLIIFAIFDSISYGAALFAWVLVYGNSLVNPFVYVLSMPAFRREVILLLGCKTRYPERPDVKSTSKNVQGVTLVKFSIKSCDGAGVTHCKNCFSA